MQHSGEQYLACLQATPKQEPAILGPNIGTSYTIIFCM